MNRILLAMLSLSTFRCIGLAQQQSTSPNSQASFQWVAPQRAEVRRLVDSLVGTWRTTEKFEANEFLKSGATGTGTFTIRQGPGGNSVVLNYSSRSSAGPYSSTRIIYWDAGSNVYRAFYCDSLQPTGCGEAGEGKIEGNDLVFTSTTPGPAGPLTMTQRFANVSKE